LDRRQGGVASKNRINNMIKLHRVNDDDIYVNEIFIESIQINSQKDVVVKLHNGTTYAIKENPEEILKSIAEWNVRIRRPDIEKAE
jgi:uncharacterized protein YlzI (FlbEa/FlbD family)